jgi:hypothetical protein
MSSSVGRGMVARCTEPALPGITAIAFIIG